MNFRFLFLMIDYKESLPDEMNITHHTEVFHIAGKPTACIIDANPLNKKRYDSFSENPDLEASLSATGVFSEEKSLGMFLKLKIKSLDDFFEYVLQPNEEFTDVLIKSEEIFFIGEQLKPIFTIRKLDVGSVINIKKKLDERK